MAIKQQGGVFGRNPSFNDVDALSLNVSGNGSIKQLAVGGDFSPSYDIDLRDTDPVISLRDTDANNNQTLAFIGSNVNGALVLRADPNNVGNFSTRIDFCVDGTVADAYLDKDKNLTLVNGNLIIGTSGRGIDFSATAGTGTSELFDDYEEGTWTPTLKAFTTDFDGVTYNPIRAASYTKIGRVVKIQLTIRTDAITVGSASGVLGIGGLPFAPVGGNVGASALAVSAVSSFASNNPMAAEISGGVSGIYLLYRSSVSGNTAYCQAADAGTGANANYVRVSGTYTTT